MASKVMNEVLRQLQAKTAVPTGTPGKVRKPSEVEKAQVAAVKAAERHAAGLRIDIAKLLHKMARPGQQAAARKRFGLPTPGAPPTGPGPVPTPQGLPTPGQYHMPQFPMQPTPSAPTARGPRTMPPGGTPPTIPPSGRGPQAPGAPPVAPPYVPGTPTQAPPSVKPGGGLTIGVEMRPPHTLRTGGDAHGKGGRPCRTDRWFDRCGLVYDASQPADGPMGFNNPRLFLAGTSFRCFYPASTRADFAAIMSSGSSGRWIRRWSQRSSYVKF